MVAPHYMKTGNNTFVFIMTGVLAFALLFFGLIYISNEKTDMILSEINSIKAEMVELSEKTAKDAGANTVAYLAVLLEELGKAEEEPEVIPLGPAVTENADNTITTTEEMSVLGAMEADMSVMESLIAPALNVPEETAVEADEEGWEDVAVPLSVTGETADEAVEGEIE